MNEIYQVSQTLITRVQQASWVNKDKPHVQWAWVAGYFEGLLKNLPSNKDNLQYLKNELRSIEEYINQK